MAKLIGNLSLVLRSAGDDPADKDGAAGAVAAGPTHTWDSEVSPLIRHEEPVTAVTNVVVTILRGDGKDAGGSGVTSSSPAATVAGGNAGAAGAKGIVSSATALRAGVGAGLAGSGGL